jgi:pantoate kinase
MKVDRQIIERLSYIANVCRSKSTDRVLDSMLGELDATLQEILDEPESNRAFLEARGWASTADE